MEITIELVKKLVKEQFPQWQELEIYPVAKSGHDNRTFHLGDTMTVRLPSGKDYAAQVAKENQWLPYLQEHLVIQFQNRLRRENRLAIILSCVNQFVDKRRYVV